MKKKWIPVLLTLIMGMIVTYLLIVGDKPERWYVATQVRAGELLFEKHCAQCHGLQAQGVFENWKQRLPDGSLPPPPLNGTAHAWHHDMPLLLEIVQQGGALYDGKMPGFDEVLNKQEQLAVVAYFQSFWDDEIYHLWGVERDKP